MSKSKGSTTATATPVATFTKPVPAAPATRKGNSTIENPVGVTWVLCLTEYHNAQVAGAPTPRRKALVLAAQGLGVAYYTARTQVAKFMTWHNKGRPEGGLPRGVSLTISQ